MGRSDRHHEGAGGMNGYSRIVRVVSTQSGVAGVLIVGHCRADVLDARALAMYLVRLERKIPSIYAISRHFHCDRATVVNAIKRVEDRVRTCEEFAESVRQLRRGLEA